VHLLGEDVVPRGERHQEMALWPAHLTMLLVFSAGMSFVSTGSNAVMFKYFEEWLGEYPALPRSQRGRGLAALCLDVRAAFSLLMFMCGCIVCGCVGVRLLR
jgi:hypothetical protein